MPIMRVFKFFGVLGILGIVWGTMALAGQKIVQKKGLDIKRPKNLQNSFEPSYLHTLGPKGGVTVNRLGSGLCFARHHTEGLPSYLHDLEKDTLVVLGPGYELVRPSDSVFKSKDYELVRPEDDLSERQQIKFIGAKDVLFKINKNTWKYEPQTFRNNLWNKIPKKRVNFVSPDLMKNWKTKGIRVVALVNGTQDSGRDYIQQIKDRGYPLKDFWRDVPDKFLYPSKLSRIIPWAYPPSVLFSAGVLYGNGNDPENALGTFVKGLSWKPKRILFLDAVYTKPGKMALTEQLCISSVYAGFILNPENRISLSPAEEAQAQFQIKTFNDTGNWPHPVSKSVRKPHPNRN